MNNLCLRKHLNKLFLVIVLLCLPLSSLGSIPVMAGRVVSPLSSSPSNESLAPCVPTITFTSVPPFGRKPKPPFKDPHEYTLYGRVNKCVDPSKYAVAVYIYPGSWWIKPTFAKPLTSINSDRTWSAKFELAA
jgi:hypothetical protein